VARKPQAQRPRGVFHIGQKVRDSVVDLLVTVTVAVSVVLPSVNPGGDAPE
jgi:hypothetical protein